MNIMNAPYFLSVDLGTSSTKVLAWDLKRRPIAEGRAGYATKQRKWDRSELDPNEVFRAFQAATKECLRSARIPAKNIKAISFSSAMHCLVGVDGNGSALFPIQTWADNRAVAQAEHLRNMARYHKLPDITGCPLHASYPLAKIRWIAENVPRLHEGVHRYVSLKSYCIGKWLGVWVEDWSMASGTGLLDIRSRNWNSEALQAAHVHPEQLPGLVSPYQIVAELKDKSAGAMGLAPGTLVIAGAGDGPLANLGSGNMREANIHLSMGTSAAVRAVRSRPSQVASSGLWCYVLDKDHWVVGGASNNGANLDEWFLSHLDGLGKSSQQADRLLMRRKKSNPGLLFYPYLQGERSPYWNSHLRGALLGMAYTHSNADIMQAALEGVAFQMKDLAGLVRKAMGQQGSKCPVICSGGGMRWKTLAHALANVLGEPIFVHRILDTSARGACVMAQKSLGYIACLKDAQDRPAMVEKIIPNRAKMDYYSRVERLRKKFSAYIVEMLTQLGKISSEHPRG